MKARTLTAIAVGLALPAAACGSDSADDRIVLGTILSLTGASVSEGYAQGIELAGIDIIAHAEAEQSLGQVAAEEDAERYAEYEAALERAKNRLAVSGRRG